MDPATDRRAAEEPRVRPLDTHADAYEVQMRIFRSMSPERKGDMVVEISDLTRALCRAGIRTRHPEYSDADVAQELLRLLYGEAIARAVASMSPNRA